MNIQMLQQWIVEDLSELLDGFTEDRYSIFTETTRFELPDGNAITSYPKMDLLMQISDHLERYRTARKAGLDNLQDLWADDPSQQKKMEEAHIDICHCCKDNKKKQEAEPIASDKTEILLKLKEKGWLEITVKFPSKCLECKEQIKKDEKALWQKDVGVKHTLGTWCNKMPILKEGEEVSQ